MTEPNIDLGTEKNDWTNSTQLVSVPNLGLPAFSPALYHTGSLLAREVNLNKIAAANTCNVFLNYLTFITVAPFIQLHIISMHPLYILLFLLFISNER